MQTLANASTLKRENFAPNRKLSFLCPAEKLDPRFQAVYNTSEFSHPVTYTSSKPFPSVSHRPQGFFLVKPSCPNTENVHHEHIKRHEVSLMYNILLQHRLGHNSQHSIPGRCGGARNDKGPPQAAKQPGGTLPVLTSGQNCPRHVCAHTALAAPESSCTSV